MKPYYQDDLVTLYHGDWREVLPHIGQVTAVVSDPPYGMDWDTDSTRFSGGHNPAIRGGAARQRVAGDDTPFDPTPWMQAEYCILWGLNHFPDRLTSGSSLVWIKRNDAAFGSFLSDAEIAWMKGGCGVYCFRDLSMNAIARTRVHPTQKPIDLMTWCLLFVPHRETILDPFAGSGSTLIAAKNLRRRAIGIEIEERYCEIAAERCSQDVLDLGDVA